MMMCVCVLGEGAETYSGYPFQHLYFLRFPLYSKPHCDNTETPKSRWFSKSKADFLLT